MQGTATWWDATRKFVARKSLGPVRTQVAPRIGLALGGGFARGIAHIGVLRVFERNNIPVYAIAGISAGSMVAAAYAGGSSTQQIEAIARTMRFRDVARWTISRLGLADSERMIPFLKRLLKEDRFEKMKMPLAIVASDLGNGSPIVFRGHGDVVTPIRASCSYPGLFLPIRQGGRCLVDGAITMEVPARPVRELGATRVISIHLPNPHTCPDPSSMFSVINRCFQSMSERLEHEWRRQSDLVISPAVGELAWDSFDNATRMIELGEEAGEAALPVIKNWLKPYENASNTQPLPVAV
jgi:NTE family protein